MHAHSVSVTCYSKTLTFLFLRDKDDSNKKKRWLDLLETINLKTMLGGQRKFSRSSLDLHPRGSEWVLTVHFLLRKPQMIDS